MKVLAVIEKQLLPDLNVLVGINSNPVITVHHEDLHFAIWFRAVVSEPNLPSHPRK